MVKTYTGLVGRKFTCPIEQDETIYTIEPAVAGLAHVSWSNGTERCPYKINEILTYLGNKDWTLLDK